MIFTGELIICCVCGKQQRSNPRFESQWRALEIDNEIVYACPDEFPDDKAGRDDFRKAYQVVIACGLQELIERQGKPGVPAIAAYRKMRKAKVQKSHP